MNKSYKQIIALIVTLSLGLFCMRYIITNYRCVLVVGSSMFPALRHGDYCMIRLTQDVQRGDIVTVNFGEGHIVKRVVGLPGETVMVSGRNVYIKQGEGQLVPITEIYLPIDQNLGERKEYKVGADEVFILGDNRSHSHDSRAFGPIKINQVEGKMFVQLINLCF